MKVAKISITFPQSLSNQMKDYLISLGFSRNKFNSRMWDSDLTDAALQFAIKMNERYESKETAIIAFHQKAPDEVLAYIKKNGFVFSWIDKQWHGLKSALNSAIIEDILKLGSINYIS